MRRISVDTVLVAVLAVCAITMTALVVRRELSGNGVLPPANRQVGDWEAIAHGGNAEGPIGAPATLIIFSDFQCPYCKAFAKIVDSVHANYPAVRIVERNFPLTSIHPHALDAAVAAGCAARVGRYWEMRRNLFADQALVEAGSWNIIAHTSGVVDTVVFDQCVERRGSIEQIVADTAQASKLKLHATPTVIVNGLVFARPPDYQTLVRELRRIEAEHHASARL
jgi:protein-disulfide isomerase